MAAKKKIVKPKEQPKVKEPPRDQDALGAYPTTVHVMALPERRYLKTTRILAIIALINVCVLGVFGFIIYAMEPNIRSDPKFFTRDYRFQRFATLEGYEVARTATDLLSESYVVEFIKARHTVYPNEDKMIDHWTNPKSKLVLYASPAVLSQIDLEKENIKRRIQREMLSRTVEIIWIERLRGATWVVEFETRDRTLQSPNIGKRRWRAYVKITYNPAIKYPDRERTFLNPYGFVVLEYRLGSISRRQALQSDEEQREREKEKAEAEKILKETSSQEKNVTVE